MPAIARWCFRHRFLVIATWVIVLIGLGAPAHGVEATADLIAALRGAAIAAAEHGAALRVYATDITAAFADFAFFVGAKLLWFLIAIVRLSFLLLVVAFRSLLILATEAFGVLTSFFQ
jgi:RND superfamily putative drug exporter